MTYPYFIPEFKALEGALIVLKPFTPDDITPEYVGWLNDPEVMRFSNQRFFQHSQHSCQKYFESFTGSPNRFLKIVRQSDGVMLGTMTAYVAFHHRTVDMGIMVGCRSVWGQGVGQDAWNTLLYWLLKQEFVRKVTAGTMRCNLAMVRIIVRIIVRSGMTLEAVRPQQELPNGEPQDIVYYGRLRTV
jgi:RimJ/RimL family protein N-acetyltransferase